MGYLSTKRYGHEVGLSAVFRQWKAESHCHFLHGYALSFKFIFQASSLDHRNWVVDFGGLKTLKAKLEALFDHKTLMSQDDPHLDYFKQGDSLGVLDLVIVEKIGCEAFALLGYQLAVETLKEQSLQDRVNCIEVEVAEHGSNSAIYRP
jgi:6-pyruvoyltetrahydropterin/6-carboxytetrahydropterin synthase